MNTHEPNLQLVAIFLESGFSFDFDPTLAKARPDFIINKESEIYNQYLREPDASLFSLGFMEEPSALSPTVAFLAQVARRFIGRLAQTADVEFTREETSVRPTTEDFRTLLAKVPFGIGTEFITEEWIKDIFSRLEQVFAGEVSVFPGSVEDFLRARNPEVTVFGRVFFHLVENKKDEEFPFAFLATYSTGNSKNKKASHIPLQNALLEYRGQDDLLLKLLSTVSSAADKSNLLSELVESGELFRPLKFSSEEAYTFLKEVPLYEESGILCRIPNWWKRKSSSLTLSLSVGNQEPPKVGIDSLLEFDPGLYLGEEKISEEELRALLAETSGLHLIKGKWVEVDRENLQATLVAYEKAKRLAKGGGYTMAEAMRLQLNLGETLGIEDDQVAVEVTNGEWLQEVMAKLTQPKFIQDVALGDDFRATLREYQQEGLNWLKLMQDLGFGACLADDMGLGKTVQVIALLEQMRIEAPGKALLIIPASLLANWQKELERFAPRLKHKAIYSTKDQFDFANLDEDLIITTYGLATRLEALKEVKWDLVILDEAQAIKNPGTKQTKAIKQLEAKARIALTGTPIENRLSDLWSLFDFLNSGLLGSAKEFKALTKNLGNNGLDYARLRQMISPFILRRLKTDKSIIADLPAKIELKAYTGLSKKQVVLYQKLVQELEQNLQSAEGMGRKGLVLASIMKAKQICNHPDQYLGQAAFLAQHSGKFEMVKEICETIAKKRERVLVFTQFREMTEPLADFLATIFGREGLVLHGQTPVKKRGEIVERFGAAEYIPFMILSLKAGGVGLNLTAANHVIHFDRWWNPAVENQATDRAFRIGQEKNVMVHKFVTSGTIEEKIDLMIEEKNQLATDILAASGESWITELDNRQLMELFTLSGGES
ncbi:MAG: DEAD/DEAH box helicase [Limnochordia bacterium]|nr:DEAD/DEAH box helicase [Limnochordia bacterium]